MTSDTQENGSRSIRRVNIIGDGSMACVLALLLHSKEVEVQMWGPFERNVAELTQTRRSRYLSEVLLPEQIMITHVDKIACQEADLIISAIPTQYIRDVWKRVSPSLDAATKHRPGVPVCSVAKGIENETLLRPTQIIADILQSDPSAPDDPDQPARPLFSLSGPSVASELARCLPATVSIAGDDMTLAKHLQQLFTTTWFRVYTNPDLLGVELAGATKNVIALAAGILDGLSAGNNAKSALLPRGLAEISRLGASMGASQDTFYGIAGVGDLATTCFSPTGRNRSAGELLGKGNSLDEVLNQIPGIVEGVPTTKSVMQLAQKYKVDMPITQAVYQILFEDLDPIDAVSQLMTRELKSEII